MAEHGKLLVSSATGTVGGQVVKQLREELIALGGLLTQISGALLTLTDLLSAPAHHYDRVQMRRADTEATPTQRQPAAATSLLRDRRDGYLVAYTSARTFHAGLRRCPWTGPGAT